MHKFFLIALTFICFCTGYSTSIASDKVAGYSSEEAILLGKRIYRQGILPNGEPIQAIVAGDIPMAGSMFACAECHQRSGLGSVEGSVITWPINGKELFIPRRRTGAWNPKTAKAGPGAEQRWSLPVQYQADDARPAYNDKTLARLLRTGIDPAERKLVEIMPRYLLSDINMTILIHYLKNLSSEPDPGVNSESIRFATVITEGVSKSDRDSMLSVLKAHIDAHNTQTRPHLRRSQRGPFYKTEKFGAYRKLELDVWVLKGSPQTWRNQLENYYRTKPVFALLGGISSSSWAPVHQFCEENNIPNIFPITERPVVSDTDWYTLYFSKGLYQEGVAAARFLRMSEKLDKDTRIIQYYKPESRGEEIARGFEKTWTQYSGYGIENRPLGKTDKQLENWSDGLDEKNHTAIIMLWLDREEVVASLRNKISNENVVGKVFLSWSLLNGDVDIIPDEFRNMVFVTYPYSLPVEYSRKSIAMKRWLKIRNIPITNLDIQAKMYFLGWVLPRALKQMRSEYLRDYFLEGFDMMNDQDYAIAIYPRLTFGPGQRYAAKGTYIAQLTEGKKPELKIKGEWGGN